jgi:hypothetical protein
MVQYPECAYNGDFYCDRFYDSEHNWQLVDFHFFHSQKKLYFAVAMSTVNYEAYALIEDKAIELADFPSFIKDKKDGTIMAVLPFNEAYREARKRKKKIQAKLSALPVKVQPKIVVKDYGLPVVGLHVTVNTPHIDEHVIRNFIRFFRGFGEPTKPGWKWKGETVTAKPTKGP